MLAQRHGSGASTATHAFRSKHAQLTHKAKAVPTCAHRQPALEPADKHWSASRRAALLAQTGLAAAVIRAKLATAAEASKQNSLPIDEVLDIVAHDFQTGQYYITGKLTSSIFADDCVFSDPTTRVQGTERYSKAVASLFDPSSSRADLISIKVIDPHTISAKWRFAASLNVPGKPKLKPYTGTTTYKTDNQGLICEHKEDWDISALDAFISIVLPSFGAPAAPPVEDPVAA